MFAVEEEVKSSVRIELIDSRHERWPSVLKQIDRDGGRGKLLVDPDDWLSARQCLLVALRDEDELVGHLAFRVCPAKNGVSSARPAIDAHLDDVAVRTGLGQAEVRRLLLEAAKEHAKALQVRRLVNFE